jgi:chromate transporter
MDTLKQQSPEPISLRQASWYWLKLGLISFGGPAGQIALMHHDLVEKKRWISDKRFLHALNYCMILPGGLFVLPSFFILLVLAWIYMAYGNLPAVAGVLYGIKPAVVAIVLFACYRIGMRTLKNWLLWSISILSFLAIFVIRIPFPVIILAAGLIGYFCGHISPKLFSTAAVHGSNRNDFGPALIDDDTPTPKHARFSLRRLVLTLSVGLGIWFAAMAILIGQFGWTHTITQMGWFFTKAALLTFGGAYAVLPYVYQGAVTHFHWLTTLQMMDGLALGETTPGPLIMVITFVGFVGGWNQQLFGANATLTAAILAASVATFFTFLPSFIFIFLGGPFIETTHGNLKFSAPLSAITAAVVGVIASLALFFAQQVFSAKGLEGNIDGFSVFLAIIAAGVLFRFKSGVIILILGCGLAGMVFRLWV